MQNNLIKSLPVLPIESVRESERACFNGASFDGPSDWHRFTANEQSHLFVADGTRIYGLEAEYDSVFDGADVDSVLSELGVPAINAISDDPVVGPPVRSLSLAVAQKCNLGCTYCYAEGGDFGSESKSMSLDVAMQSVERLFAETQPGDRVHLSFLGGEPLVNRDVLRRATARAREIATQREVQVGFAITTNGTLLTADDAAFFEEHAFAVTVSLDGVGEDHDQLRSYKSGRGSFADIIQRVTPLLQRQRSMQVSARVTVTPRNLRLVDTLDQLIAMGFHSVGFSPMLSSPTGHDEMNEAELQEMLARMIECGQAFEQHLIAGRRYPFSNLVTALQQLHRGTHRPYPCGAGAGYLGVSADGGLFACHRFVDDEQGRMGSLQEGINHELQNEWLRTRHVHFQEPCSGCWARYLCGGGCHHEVIRRGRPACNYIRGWLDYCLQAYVRLREAVPHWFEPAMGGTGGVASRMAEVPAPESSDLL